MKDRIYCTDGVSLSVQVSMFHYCTPRVDDIRDWSEYTEVEVGFIEDSEGKATSPPESWSDCADGDFPSDIYAYVPVKRVEEFIKAHGGERVK